MAMDMKSAIANAAKNATSPSLVAQRDQAAANAKNATSAPAMPADFMAQFAQMQAMMKQLADTNAQLMAQNAELKKAAPAKAEKKPSEPTCKNSTYSYDQKTGKLTVVFDLNADIIDPETGAPKLSKSETTTGVAFFQGNFVDKNGRKVGIGCNAYHKLSK